MLITEEIKKELDAGNAVELECIDREGLLGMEDPKYGYNRCILESNLQVSRFFVDGAGLLVFVIEPGLMMTEKELKYFRVKCPTLTFVELMHLVEDAQGKKLISAFYAINTTLQKEIAIHSKDGICTWEFNKQGIKGAADFINSLYTETFVIEHASDMEHIKRTAIIVLENGCEVCAESDCLHHGVNYIQTTYGGMNFNLSFVSLKGATVTQKRGAKC